MDTHVVTESDVTEQLTLCATTDISAQFLLALLFIFNK